VKALVACARDPSRLAPDEWATIVERARRSITGLAGPISVDRATERSHMFLSRFEESDVDGPDGTWAVLLSRSCRTVRGGLLTGDDLLARLRNDHSSTLRDVAPPFGGCVRLGALEAVLGVTDTCGFHHLYWYQGTGWAAISSSAAVLGSMASESIDERALGIYACVGNFLDCDTPYRGVRKLDAGSTCRLADGVVEVQRYVPWATVDAQPFATRGDAVDAGAAAVRASVAACLAAHPRPWIEISGGFDSRAVLAAVPSEARRGMPALTLGGPDDADVQIAVGIAARCGLEHHVVDPRDLLSRLTPDEALARVRDASRRRDYAANGAALAVIDYVDDRVESAPRLGGGNGEFGRGFYYPGQRAAAAVTDALAARLANWRILTNTAVDTGLFVPEYAAASRQWALTAISEALHEADGGWLGATDEFYLRQRMQRWAGHALTPSGHARSLLLPFLDSRYIAWARRAPPADKRGSRLFSEVIDALDPGLAAMRLDTANVSPAQLARPGPAVRIRMATSFASRAARKVIQRARRREKAPAAGTTVADLALRAWSAEPEVPESLAGHDFLDQRTISAIAAGERAVDSVSLAFLVNLQGIASVLAP
jgi:asparagine synthase (glutamine-hydrolysing)